jgi:hypothetical protein
MYVVHGMFRQLAAALARGRQKRQLVTILQVHATLLMVPSITQPVHSKLFELCAASATCSSSRTAVRAVLSIVVSLFTLALHYHVRAIRAGVAKVCCMEPQYQAHRCAR